MSEQKKYVFFESREGNKSKRIELTEDQLEGKHRNLLFAELVKTWNNTPGEQQIDFISLVNEEASKKIQDAFQSRKELDDRIDNIVKEWKRKKLGTDRLWKMIESIEKDYDYVGVTVYSGAKIVVKIHDGIQEFN